MSVNPKYYYNLSENITDGKKEYSLCHKEDKIGGLSVSSGLKENHIEYGTNSLLDLLNELNYENKELKKENVQFDILIKNNQLAYIDLEKENEQLKKQLNRLYNYFEDWYSEMTSANDFSEIWDNVKEDERWGDVE